MELGQGHTFSLILAHRAGSIHEKV
jgi:hypothetical protein